MIFSDYIELIKNLTLILSGIVASFVAIKGLHTWKVQISGKYKHETAMTLLFSILMVRDRISEYRKPFILNSETLEAFKVIEGKDPINLEETNKKNYALLFRAQKLNEALNELYKAKLNSEIIFGNVILADIEKVFSIINKLNKAKLIHDFSKSDRDLVKSKENLDSYNILFSLNNEDDIERDIKLLIKNLKIKLRSYL